MGKLLQLYTKHTIHWKSFTMHQAEAIMYCVQQVIHGGEFLWLAAKLQKPRKFSPQNNCCVRYIYLWAYICVCVHVFTLLVCLCVCIHMLAHHVNND